MLATRPPPLSGRAALSQRTWCKCAPSSCTKCHLLWLSPLVSISPPRCPGGSHTVTRHGRFPGLTLWDRGKGLGSLRRWMERKRWSDLELLLGTGEKGGSRAEWGEGLWKCRGSVPCWAALEGSGPSWEESTDSGCYISGCPNARQYVWLTHFRDLEGWESFVG